MTVKGFHMVFSTVINAELAAHNLVEARTLNDALETLVYSDELTSSAAAFF